PFQLQVPSELMPTFAGFCEIQKANGAGDPSNGITVVSPTLATPPLKRKRMSRIKSAKYAASGGFVSVNPGPAWNATSSVWFRGMSISPVVGSPVNGVSAMNAFDVEGDVRSVPRSPP